MFLLRKSQIRLFFNPGSDRPGETHDQVLLKAILTQLFQPAAMQPIGRLSKCPEF
ncbi:MAG: hypothetical protein N838_03240 [Thiohalocapsa sp. PB-PSB1]|nr:MAG: hypothetical protein N838_03240 [Thiohalocapsa sp. PB-PSB1]